MTSATGGQPGTLMMGLSVMTLWIGTAVVGFGRAAWTQPQEAHEPQASGLHAVHAVQPEGRIALAGENVLAVIFLDGLLENFLSLVSGGGHDGVVVVQGDHGQDDVAGQRMTGADERFRTAGALLTMQPYDRGSRLGFHRISDLARELRAQPKSRGG
jgi:hypothetical protein